MKGRRLIPALAALLLVQLALGAWLWQPERSSGPARARLLDFDRAAVDAIEISDGEGHSLRLVHGEAGWRLPESLDFPATGVLVDGLLNSLNELRPGLAAATSDTAAKRFAVADDHFERRIRLLAGDRELAALYLGDAAGPRRSYGRTGGDSAIYPLVFDRYEAEADADAWTDKAYLHRDPATLTRVDLGDLQLVRDGDDWRLADQSEGERTDAAAASDMVRRLTSMNFMAVQAKAAQAPQGKALLTASLHFRDGENGGERTVEYRFADPGQGGDPLLWVSDRDYLLRIATFDFEPLAKMSRDKLVRAAAPPEALQPSEG